MDLEDTADGLVAATRYAAKGWRGRWCPKPSAGLVTSGTRAKPTRASAPRLRWNRRVRRARPQRPVLITSAERSRREEIGHRERRYVMAMMVRVVLFIVAVVALHSWLRFVGMIAAIAIPWLAVSYANAGPICSRKGQPSLYRRDLSALTDDPYPLGDGGQTIVEGEWTGPRSREDRPAEPAEPAEPAQAALSGALSERESAHRRS